MHDDADGLYRPILSCMEEELGTSGKYLRLHYIFYPVRRRSFRDIAFRRVGIFLSLASNQIDPRGEGGGHRRLPILRFCPPGEIVSSASLPCSFQPARCISRSQLELLCVAFECCRSRSSVPLDTSEHSTSPTEQRAVAMLHLNARTHDFGLRIMSFVYPPL